MNNQLPVHSFVIKEHIEACMTLGVVYWSSLRHKTHSGSSFSAGPL
jgi:hypothetical protein